MKSYIFALRKQDYDLHSTVFSLFKALNIRDFTPNHPDKKTILFYANKQFIICRTNGQIDGIPLKEEFCDFKKNEMITGSITLPRDTPKSIMTKAQFDAYVEKHGRKPKYSQQVKYHRLLDEEIPEYATRLLNTAGLEIQQLKFNDGSDFAVSGRNKAIRSVDIHFDAKIVDIDAFKNAWFNGIGRNKTYGFGMLRVVKL